MAREFRVVREIREIRKVRGVREVRGNNGYHSVFWSTNLKVERIWSKVFLFTSSSRFPGQ